MTPHHLGSIILKTGYTLAEVAVIGQKEKIVKVFRFLVYNIGERNRASRIFISLYHEYIRFLYELNVFID